MTTPINRRRCLLALGSTAAMHPALADPPIVVALRPMVLDTGSPLQMRSLLAPERPAVVTSICTDPLGEFLAVACDDGSIRLLDAESLVPKVATEGHRDLVRALSFSPGGEQLASAGNDGQLLIWNRGEWSEPNRRLKLSPAIASIAFSPDGMQLAAAGFAKEVLFIDLSSAEVRSRPSDCPDLRAVAFRGDNQLLVVAGRNGHAHLFEPNSRQPLGEVLLHRGRIRDASFLDDGRTLTAVSESGMLVALDTEARELSVKMQITSSRLFALAVVDRNLVAVAGSDDVVRVVDVKNRRIVHQFVGHQGSITTLAASPDWLYSGGFDATLRRWPLQRLPQRRERIAGGDKRLER